MPPCLLILALNYLSMYLLQPPDGSPGPSSQICASASMPIGGSNCAYYGTFCRTSNRLQCCCEVPGRLCRRGSVRVDGQHSGSSRRGGESGTTI